MLDDAKIAELKSKYKDLVAIGSKDGKATFVFRKPKRLEYDQWFDQRTSSAAGLSLARQCLVYPTEQEFMSALEDYPGLLMCRDGVVDTITDLAGGDGGAAVKKL